MQGKYRVLTAAAACALAAEGTAFGATKAVFVGTPGPDTIFGTPTADAIYGKAGGDSLHGRAGNDVIYGGKGDDVIKGADGNDVEYGGDGADVMWVGRGADMESGGPGNDVLHALADNDRVDIVDCGAGRDVAWLNVAEKGKYVVRGCEVRNWIVPTPEQAAEETGD
jgi:Ca2+-binding RTX toxin-like protein